MRRFSGIVDRWTFVQTRRLDRRGASTPPAQTEEISMRMSIPAAVLALPALAISLAAVAAPADGSAVPPTKATVENTTAASLIVVRDRATGKLRAPTPEEVEKLMASGRRSAVKSEPRDVRSHTGAEGVALGDSMLHDQVVRKTSRGVVEQAHDREASHD
jgi:hypothetical protein